MQSFDYIIVGSGLSGLLMAYRMQSDSWFDGKKIALIERDIKNSNDRTWCFWEENEGEWDDIIFKEWKTALVASPVFENYIDLQSYRYKMLRGIDFYGKIKNIIQNKSNFTWIHDEIVGLDEKEHEVHVLAKKENYTCKQVLDSILDVSVIKNQPKYPYLKQHFIGWFIRTSQPVFDDKTVSFMDFSIPQNGNTRFMYVLPTSSTEALVEYTLFSEHLLEKTEYENAILEYLREKGIKDFEIIEKEKGDIPMTCFPFHSQNSKRIIKIGSAGGWTKASTGFTFLSSCKQSIKLTSFLKTEKTFLDFYSKRRFKLYDAIFLEVLHQHNELGSDIFNMLFERNAIQPIFKFLDDESTLIEEFNIINSLPKMIFIKALSRVIWKGL